MKNPILGCAIGLSTLGSPCPATVSVTVNGGPCPTCIAFGAQGYLIRVYNLAAPEVVVSATGGERLFIIEIANTDDDTAATLSVFAEDSEVVSIAAFFDEGANGELWVEEVVAESLGSLYANHIGAVSIAENITGFIEQVASALSPTATGIVSLVSSGGDITADVTAVQRIAEISAGSGSIGASGNHSSISSETSIGAITAEAVYASIAILGSAADLDSLIVTQGNFVGSLSCRKVTGTGAPDAYGLKVEGDLDADITHTAAMATGFRIGGSLTSTSDISITPANGLTKQMIFDANDGGGGWNGHVKLNGANLSGEPYYTNTATSVGGGSAGLATFHLHDESCDPVNGAEAIGKRPSILCTGEEDCCLVFSKAYLRLYGPVSLHATLPSVTVKKWNGSSWAAVGWTPVTTHPTSDHRVVEVKRASGYWDLGDYLIEPISGRMLSEDVDGAPNVDDFDYTITLYDTCESEQGFTGGGFDMNSDGRMTSADLASWVASPRDLNADGQSNATDLARLMRIVALFSN